MSCAVTEGGGYILTLCENHSTNMNFEHQLQCNKVVRSRQVAGGARVCASDSIRIQYENFRLADVVIVNGLPRIFGSSSPPRK